MFEKTKSQLEWYWSKLVREENYRLQSRLYFIMFGMAELAITLADDPIEKQALTDLWESYSQRYYSL